MAIELRDHFAIEAMKALSVKLEDPAVLAKMSYRVADAMLKARRYEPPRISVSKDSQSSPSGQPRVQRKSLKPKVTPAQIPQILQLKKEGLSNKQIADRLAINGQSVNGIVAVSRFNPNGLIRKAKV